MRKCLHTEIGVQGNDPKSILALNGVRAIVRPGLLCTPRIDPPIEPPQRREMLIIPEEHSSDDVGHAAKYD